MRRKRQPFDTRGASVLVLKQYDLADRGEGGDRNVFLRSAVPVGRLATGRGWNNILHDVAAEVARADGDLAKRQRGASRVIGVMAAAVSPSGEWHGYDSEACAYGVALRRRKGTIEIFRLRVDPKYEAVGRVVLGAITSKLLGGLDPSVNVTGEGLSQLFAFSPEGNPLREWAADGVLTALDLRRYLAQTADLGTLNIAFSP